MKLRPVDETVDPAYPSCTDATVDERMLRDHVPRRWQLGRKCVGAISLLVAANLTGCTSEVSTTPNDPFPTTSPVVYEAAEWTESIFADDTPVPMNQPVMLGCIAIMPPAVYSEEEAAQGLVEDPFAE